MVRLEVNHTMYAPEKFYFANMEDCETFMQVFKDHMCNIPWKKPVEAPSFPEMTEKYRRYMEVISADPKKAAESDLMWGFSLVDSLHIGLTGSQQSFVKAVQDHCSGDDN